MSVVSGIQGQLLEVTVVGCVKLKDTEWISRQDPYVVVEYGSTKFRTRTCTDGGKNPTFQEKFVFKLIEGLRELNVVVWNSNTLTYDDLIGSGKIQLQKVLSQGYDDSTWPLQDKKGRHAGEVRLIMHYASANKHTTSYAPQTSYAPSAPPRPYANVPAPHAPLYSSPPPSLSAYPPSSSPYPPSSSPYPPSSSTYPPSSSAYPPSSSPYPPSSSTYPPSSSAYPPSSSTYPPSSYQAPAPYPTYPTHAAVYPPPPYNHQPAPYPPVYPPPPSAYPSVYPPPPQDPRYYPPGSYPTAPYPPPPY